MLLFKLAICTIWCITAIILICSFLIAREAWRLRRQRMDHKRPLVNNPKNKGKLEMKKLTINLLSILAVLITTSAMAEGDLPNPTGWTKIPTQMGPIPDSPAYDRAVVYGAILAEGAVTNPISTTDVPPVPASTLGGVLDAAKGALQAGFTNCDWIAYGMYASGLKQHWGGGVACMYPWSQYVDTGVRIDWVNGGFWMPSGNATLQLPLGIGPITVTPFTYAGIGVPLSGAVVGSFTLPGVPPRDNNGQPTAILGAGLAIDLYTKGSGAVSAFSLIGDVEKWTGFSGNQYRAGGRFHFGKW